MDKITYYINRFIESSTFTTVVIGLVIIVLALLLRNKISRFILNAFSKIAFKGNDKDLKKELLHKSLQKPIAYLLVLIFVFIAIMINIKSVIVIKAFKILATLIVCWALVNYLSDNLFLFIHFGDNADDKMNTTAIKFISNILKFVVIAFAIVMVISELGYNINGLLTGLGVGGLAISLAAQDAVSNLISGFIIVLEKPFVVGEMIQTSSIQGTVEDITMRSTKIRTLDDSLVTTPNSSLTGDAIINLSRMNKRKISIEFGLVYSTSNELLKKCEDDIRKYLIDNDEILDTPIRVNLSKLDGSSINFEITCYTKTSIVDEYLIVLGKVNYKIKEIIEQNGAEFAFPSTSIYIEKN